MIRPVRRLLTLPWSDRRLFVDALLMLWAVRLALRLAPLRTVSRLLAGLEHLPRRHDAAERVVWAIETATPYAPGVTCLTRALAARTMLHRRGHRADLRIGFARDGDRWAGHAWLESGDHVYLDGALNLALYDRMQGLERDNRTDAGERS